MDIYTPMFIFHNSQVEKIQMFIDGNMYEQNVVYAYDRILSSLKKDRNSDTCYSIDGPWKHCVKRNKA